MKRKNLISESGAIMLEVVAVLSLMGLMGAMLFRQMYVRNQELHNIQMASEIRVVKDAFAAWIQAESTRLGSICEVGSGLDCARVCDLEKDQVNEIKEFMPEGYFSDETGAAVDPGDILNNNYILKLVGYHRGNRAPGILTYYGVVIPDPEATLPNPSEDGSWNFRRAARVAMLIGVDGGAYDPTITDNMIAGAVGTWNLPIEGAETCDGKSSVPLIGDGNKDIPTYVAITGTDVFQPEIDIPSLKLGLEDDWSVAMNNATAYGNFTAGATSKCYEKQTPRVTDVDASTGYATLRSDTVDAAGGDCFPAFYVESGDDNDPSKPKATGSVHVLNDLTIGREWDSSSPNYEKSAMRFDKDGMIVFEKAEVEDPQNGNEKINYVLDPKYTSVMNDIKLMSRGGASLSDILPNYILKEQKELSCTIVAGTTDPHLECSSDLGCSCTMDAGIAYPNCPTGYSRALVMIPKQFGGAQDSNDHLIGSYHVTIGSDTYNLWLGANPASRNPGRILDVKDTFRVSFSSTDCKIDGASVDNAWCPKVTYYGVGASTAAADNKSRLSKDETVVLTAQSYCVFDETAAAFSGKLPQKNRGAAVGATGGTDISKVKTKAECLAYGGSWDSSSNTCANKAAAAP